jgi:hypothetical protein
MIEPIKVFAVPDQLGSVKPIERCGQGVVIAVPNTSLGEALHSAIRMMN